ncbi:MAG: hypothetical protein NT080_09755 [Spirochaetes bacterium]|nr:hypothetical protein [Spirochaetota bacterium]
MKKPSFLRFRPITGELKAAPLFIDTAINILASLFVFVWGLLFLSNPLYQFSSFLRTRNALITERNAERYLDDIVCIGLDQEAILAGLPLGRDGDGNPVEPPTDRLSVTIGLINEAVKAVGDYAEAHPGQRTVIGIDYPFALAERDTPLLDSFLGAVGKLPPNAFVVVGSMIALRPDSLTTLRSSQMFNVIAEKHPDVLDKLFLGHIHRLDAAMRSGNDSDGGSQVAVGYAPIFRSGGQKTFYSLPLSMFVVGEIMEEKSGGGWDFETDFYEGFSRYSPPADADPAAEGEDPISRRLRERTGRGAAELSTLTYYNFFSKSDIRDPRFRNHYIWHSTIRPPLDPGNPLSEIANGFGSIGGWETTTGSGAGPGKAGPVRYFFVAPAEMADYLLQAGERNDTMVTPAAEENSFTYERESALGVMGHVAALSNLRNRFFIDKAPDWIVSVVSILAGAAAALATWRYNVSKSLFISASGVFAMFAASFALFCLGVFIPVRAMVASTLLAFSVTALVRFVFTMMRNDVLETASTRFFGWDKLATLKSMPEWHKPAMKPGLVVMSVVMKRTPKTDDEESDEYFHAEVRDGLADAVFEEIERRDGMHVLGPTDDILGVWNYPSQERESAARAFDCADAVLGRVREIQAKADRLSRGRSGYRVFLDVCVHVCDAWAGFSVRNDSAAFSVSGTGVSMAASFALSRSYDRMSSLAVSEAFAVHYGKSAGTPLPGDWELLDFGRDAFRVRTEPEPGRGRRHAEKRAERRGIDPAREKGAEE